jgi:CHAT domain-containing protein/Flp pilus assembly protein TadD
MRVCRFAQMALAQLLSRPVSKVILLASLLVGAGAWRLFFYESDFDKALRAFKNACQNDRGIEARVSALAYAPHRETRGDTPEAAGQVMRARAQAALVDAAAQTSGPETENALGQFYLVNRQFYEAVEHLDNAVRLSPGNAQFHSDFAAALLEKGKADSHQPDVGSGQILLGQALKEYGQALEQAEEALRLHPSLSEALYNRALCCQQLMLWNEARQGWQSYLEKDSTTPWAEEARKQLDWAQNRGRREQISESESFQRFVHAYENRDYAAARLALHQARSGNGNSVVEELIGAFLAQSSETQNLQPRAALSMLAFAAQIEKDTTGDAYLYDLWRYYRRTSPAQWRVIAGARRELAHSYKLLAGLHIPEASSGYEKARNLFLAAGDGPEALRATHWVGRCFVLQPDIEKAFLLLQSVIKTAEAKRYHDLYARTLYAKAMLQTHSFEYSAAVATSLEAEKLFQLVGDTQNVARTTIQLAEEYQELSDNYTSLAYAQRILRVAAESGLENPLQWQACGLLAFNFESLGLTAAAIDCWKEALSLGADYPLLASRAFGYLGVVYAKVKDYSRAIDSAAAALDIGTRLGSNGRNIVANSCLMLGDIHRRACNDRQAIEFYDRSSALYKELNLSVYDYAVHKGKLLAYIALGDDEAAGSELQAALTLMEQFRSKILEYSKRDAFFDAEQDIYDIAIDFEYSKRQDIQRAFDLSEESRARSFLDLSESQGRVEMGDRGPDLKFSSISRPLDFAGVQQGLHEQTEIVQYSVLKDKIVVWVISKTSISSRQTPIAVEQLEELILGYLNAASQPEPDPTRDRELAERSRELYRILISPIEPFLDRNKQICIVPDKMLNYLPFSALISPTTGSYMLQDYLLMSAPSSTLFKVCSKSAARKADGRIERLLMIARPAFDHQAFPLLSDLPDAGREADQVKRYYEGSIPLIGEQADKASVLGQIREADVLHFATHSLADASSPLRSKLLLAAADDRDDNAIEVADIYRLKLARPRLVVLSSCKSGIEGTNRGEGAISLARPFIAAGVPLVIASLHEVDSAATADLMIAFHKYRKTGGLSSVEALRQAQLDMINGSIEAYRHPFYWAAFVAYGGFARF